MQIEIRDANIDDANKIKILEDETSGMPWSLDSIKYDIDKNENAIVIVANCYGEPVGYADIWKTNMEANLNNIATKIEYRRHKIATKLLTFLEARLKKENIEKLFLEVRKSNSAAIALYEKNGFIKIGIRKAYYLDNKEDAILMVKDL